MSECRCNSTGRLGGHEITVNTEESTESQTVWQTKDVMVEQLEISCLSRVLTVAV